MFQAPSLIDPARMAQHGKPVKKSFHSQAAATRRGGAVLEKRGGAVVERGGRIGRGAAPWWREWAGCNKHICPTLIPDVY